MEVSTKTLIVHSQSHENPIRIIFKGTKNLLQLLNANKVGISQSCEGSGTCTTCRIFVVKNADSFCERTEIESERATERNFADYERLACQCDISDSVEIKLSENKNY